MQPSLAYSYGEHVLSALSPRLPRELGDAGRAGGEADTPQAGRPGGKRQLHRAVSVSLSPSLSPCPLRLSERNPHCLHEAGPDGAPFGARSAWASMAHFLTSSFPSGGVDSLWHSWNRLCPAHTMLPNGPLRNHKPVPPRASPREATPGSQTLTLGHANSRSP